MSLIRLALFVSVVAGVSIHYATTSGRTNGLASVSLLPERVSVRGDGTVADVILRVNAGDEPLGPVVVWWIVATPGAESPWATPRFVSSRRYLEGVGARSSIRVDWLEMPIALAPGTYEVTGWIHKVVGPGATEHLAGGPLGTFKVTRPSPPTIRLNADASHAAGPLTLTDLSMHEVDRARQRVSVSATIQNRSSVPLAGQAYWVISRYTDAKPFLRPLWRTDWEAIPPLASGEKISLGWSDDIGLPEGTYGLSIWIHAMTEQGWQHSHASSSVPLQLGPNPSQVQRAGPGTGAVVVRRATVTDDRHLRLGLDFEESSSRDIRIDVERLSERRRFDWQRTDPGPSDFSQVVKLVPGSSRVIDTPAGISCDADARLTRVTVFEASNHQLDDVLVDVCA